MTMDITPKKVRRVLTDPAYARLVARGRVLDVQRWLRRRRGEADPPRNIVVFLTDLCNLRCKFCGQWGENGVNLGKPTIQMGMDTFHRIVDEVAPFKPHLILMGGEPLVNKSWPECVDRIKGEGMSCSMITNGTLITEDVARMMVEKGLDAIAVSVDGTPETHDSIRGKGNYGRVMAGVERVFAAKEAAGARHPEITLSATVCEKTHHRLVDAAEHFRSMPIQRFNIQHLFWISPEQMQAHNTGFQAAFGLDALNMEGLVQEPGNIDVEVLLREIHTLREREFPWDLACWPPYPDDVLREYYNKGDNYVRTSPKSCEFIWNAVAIYPDGQLTPCMNFPAGKIQDKGFLEIWNSEEYRRFRRWLDKDGYQPVCQRCCN